MKASIRVVVKSIKVSSRTEYHARVEWGNNQWKEKEFDYYREAKDWCEDKAREYNQKITEWQFG